MGILSLVSSLVGKADAGNEYPARNLCLTQRVPTTLLWNTYFTLGEIMKSLLMIVVILLSACSTTKTEQKEPPNTELILDSKQHPMTRNEVIMAINECEANKTRAVVITGRRKINGYTAEVTVDVTCAPKYPF
jgi:hypothetical protein